MLQFLWWNKTLRITLKFLVWITSTSILDLETKGFFVKRSPEALVLWSLKLYLKCSPSQVDFGNGLRAIKMIVARQKKWHACGLPWRLITTITSSLSRARGPNNKKEINSRLVWKIMANLGGRKRTVHERNQAKRDSNGMKFWNFRFCENPIFCDGAWIICANGCLKQAQIHWQ